VHNKGEWMFSYRLSLENSNTLRNGTNKIDADGLLASGEAAPTKMRSEMHMLMLMYGVTDKISIMAMSSHDKMNMQMQLPSESHHGSVSDHRMNSEGFGDTKLFMLYNFLNSSAQQFILNAGISLPTGNTFISGTKDDHLYANTHLPYCMQTGSGTFDLLPGLTYLYQKGGFSFSAQGQGIVRTNLNSEGYKKGNVIDLNLWSAYKVGGFFAASARAEYNNVGKMTGSDKLLNVTNDIYSNTQNYGGSFVKVYPGFNFQFKKNCRNNVRAGVEVGVPLYNNVNGTQLQSANTLNFLFSCKF
jgi:hypothetical protein